MASTKNIIVQSKEPNQYAQSTEMIQAFGQDRRGFGVALALGLSCF
jgi:hypothetical protein